MTRTAHGRIAPSKGRDRLTSRWQIGNANVYCLSGATCTKVPISPGTSYFSATEVNYADFVAGTTSYE